MLCLRVTLAPTELSKVFNEQALEGSPQPIHQLNLCWARMVWLWISIEGKWFATFHGSFQVIKPIPWIMWLILSLSSLSIKACLYALSKLVSSSRSSRVWSCKSLLCTHKAKSKWGDSCHPKRERLVSHPNKLCKTCVADYPAKGGFDVRTMVVFFFVVYQ